jgi:nucleoside-diphosphate-sugar epimerase
MFLTANSTFWPSSLLAEHHQEHDRGGLSVEPGSHYDAVLADYCSIEVRQRDAEQPHTPRRGASRDAVDLRDHAAVDYWFDQHRPEDVLLVAARARGIHANGTHPGDFLYDNLVLLRQ